jgi:NAD(P)-dependent dehydrogenase (short-subunit alcohol dehydrogenase family)
MIEQHVNPSVLAGYLATFALAEFGVLLFTGAAAAFKHPTPNILAYSLAKTAIHSLALNISERTHIPSTSCVLTILPEVIDTPANRQSMPSADYSKWVDPVALAAIIKLWAEALNRPENGSFIVLKSEQGEIVFEFV